MARILLAEDEFLIRMVLAEELTAAGHDVVEADSGDDAVLASESGKRFDLLLTDIHMPGSLNGIALAALLRERQPDIPVIYVTGRPEALSERGTFDAIEALVRKPYSPSEVVAVVNRLLAAAVE
jgi:CheY-like chemotaxis protein